MSLPSSSAPAAPSEDSLSNDANQDEEDRKKEHDTSNIMPLKKEEKLSEVKKDSDDMDIMDNTECKFNVNSFKIFYVVNSESYLYKRLALRRAKEVNSTSMYIEYFCILKFFKAKLGFLLI